MVKRKCKADCQYQMLESSTTGEHSFTKYVCDLYEQDLECHYKGFEAIFYRCNECTKELEELEIIEDMDT